MRVVRNKSFYQVRARRELIPFDDLNTSVPIDCCSAEVVETLLRSEALSRAIAALPTNLRRAWLMRKFSASSYVIIAAELEVPVLTVRAYWRGPAITLHKK